MATRICGSGGLAAVLLMAFLLCGCTGTQNGAPAPIAAGASAADQSTSRIRLTAPTTFFVSPSGSDAADGLTANTPWQTLQHAYDTIKNNYDLAGNVVTIKLEDGTYGPVNGRDNVVFCDGYIVGQVSDLRFVGNPDHPENVVIKGRSNNLFEIMNTRVNLDGMTLTGTGSTVGMLSYFGARVTFYHIIFGPMGTGINLSAYGGIIKAFSDYQITGSAGYHMLSNTPGSRIDIDNKVVTISGSPHFSAAFAVAENLALISSYGNTFPGTPVTGTRYIVQSNSVIQVSGGPDHFPGDSDGSAGSGGIYISSGK
jgi:hypothetical protein